MPEYMKKQANGSDIQPPAAAGDAFINAVDSLEQCALHESVSIASGKSVHSDGLLAEALSMELDPDQHDAAVLSEIRAEEQANSVEAYHQMVTELVFTLANTPAFDSLRTDSEWAAEVEELASSLIDENPTPNNIQLRTIQNGCVSELRRLLSMHQEELPAETAEQLERAIDLADHLSEVRDALFTGNDAYREERILRASLSMTRTLREDRKEARQKGNGSLEDLADSIQEHLDELRAAQSNIKFLSDLPRITADGITRTQIHVQEPEVLQANRERRGLHAVDCEVCVIGGGPGGISSAIYLGELGIDTVVFEAGYFGQAFSDARAKSVHQMRTDENLTSIAPAGVVADELVDKYGMPAFRQREHLKEQAEYALQRLSQRAGYDAEFEMQKLRSPDDPTTPVKRNELFAYLAYLAQQASNLEQVQMLEQAPVSSVRWDPESERFHVRTAAGHEVKAKKLVVGCGFVGPEAEWARDLPDLERIRVEHPDRMVSIRSEHDLTRENDRLTSLITDLQDGVTTEEGSSQLIVSQALVGHTEIRQYISLLPDGTRGVMIGGGESALKGALEFLALNPDAKIDVFMSGKLEPYQYQFPITEREGNPILRSIADREFAAENRKITKEVFGTPIVADTMLAILEEVRSGRMRIFEMGEHFSEQSLNVEYREDKESGRAQIEICLKPGESRVREALEGQEAEWRQYGLIPEGGGLVNGEHEELALIDGPIIIATGYDKKRLCADHPLLKQLVDQGLVDISDDGREIVMDPEHGIKAVPDTSRTEGPTGDVYIVGSVQVESVFDTAIPGISVRSHVVANAINDEEETRAGLRRYREETRQTESERGVRERVLRSNGISHRDVEPEEMAPEVRFPRDGLLQKYARDPEARSNPAVHFMLTRGDELQERVRGALKTGPLKPDSWLTRLRNGLSDLF